MLQGQAPIPSYILPYSIAPTPISELAFGAGEKIANPRAYPGFTPQQGSCS